MRVGVSVCGIVVSHGIINVGRYKSSDDGDWAVKEESK